MKSWQQTIDNSTAPIDFLCAKFEKSIRTKGG